MSTTEVYSILSHGVIQSAEILSHKQRNKIAIIYIGTEGSETYMTPTYLLIHYFLQKYGSIFMKKLLNILVEHGENYISSFHPNNTPLEQDIRFMFNVNAQDLKKYPSTVLRAYYGGANVANVDLFCKIPNETILYRSLFQNQKFDHNTHPYFFSSTNMSYSFETMFYQANSLLFNLIYPFGLLNFNEQNKNFSMLQRINYGGFIPLKSVLDYIHHTSTSKNKIVLMLSCKGLNEKTMMDFDIKKFPIEKVYTRTLVDMMTSLKLTDASQQVFTRKRKRKTPTKSKSKSPRKKTKVV